MRHVRRLAPALATVAALGAGPACAEFVITESNAGRYPVGAVMPAPARVSLARRERIAFIDGAGVVREAVGRFEGRLGDLGALASNQRALRASFGRPEADVAPPEPVGRDAPDGALGASPVLEPEPEPEAAERAKGRGGAPGGAGRGGGGPDPADR